MAWRSLYGKPLRAEALKILQQRPRLNHLSSIMVRLKATAEIISFQTLLYGEIKLNHLKSKAF